MSPAGVTFFASLEFIFDVVSIIPLFASRIERIGAFNPTILASQRRRRDAMFVRPRWDRTMGEQNAYDG